MKCCVCLFSPFWWGNSVFRLVLVTFKNPHTAYLSTAIRHWLLQRNIWHYLSTTHSMKKWWFEDESSEQSRSHVERLHCSFQYYLHYSFTVSCIIFGYFKTTGLSCCHKAMKLIERQLNFQFIFRLTIFKNPFSSFHCLYTKCLYTISYAHLYVKAY